MAKINLVYLSRGGNTARLAERIAGALSVKAIDITHRHAMEETDLLFIGTGVYGGKPDDHLMKYLDNLPAGAIRGAAVFCTSASGGDKTELLVNLLRHKGIAVFPERYLCRGKFLFLAGKHPDEEDLRKGEEWAQRVCTAFAE